MDCSSPSAIAWVIGKSADCSITSGSDGDADRHGIVTPDAGLLNPNHFLPVAISSLLAHRHEWADDVAVGKTLVSSSLIDRVVDGLGRRPATTRSIRDDETSVLPTATSGPQPSRCPSR